MSAPPYMKFFWGDYHKATRHLTRDQHGAYFLLIGEAWWLGGSLPDDDRLLAAWALCSPSEWAEMKDIITGFFTLRRGKWVHDRVREELAHYEDVSRKRKSAGKRGGSVKPGKDERNPEAIASQKAAKPEPEPEPEPEKEKNPRKPPEGADLFGEDESPPEPKDDVREAFHLWNALAADYGLPVARDLTEGRRRAIGKRLKVAGLPGWREALEAVKVSPLCRGDNDRRWKADLDFVCQAKSFTRLREGGYGTGAGAKPGAQPAATVRAIFDGPPALRASVAAAAGEPFAVKYIDQCRWDGARRVLIAKTGFAADEIRNELRRWLAEKQVGVEVAGQMAGAAA